MCDRGDGDDGSPVAFLDRKYDDAGTILAAFFLTAQGFVSPEIGIGNGSGSDTGDQRTS